MRVASPAWRNGAMTRSQIALTAVAAVLAGLMVLVGMAIVGVYVLVIVGMSSYGSNK